MLLDKRQIKAVIDAVKHYQTFNVSINSDRYIEFEVIINRGEQTNLINNYTLNRISGEFVEKTNKYSSSNKKFIENLFTTYGICSKKKAIF